jgi:hypothetical protein
MEKRAINNKLLQHWAKDNPNAMGKIFEKSEASLSTLQQIFAGTYNGRRAPGRLMRRVFCEVSGFSEDELFPVIKED